MRKNAVKTGRLAIPARKSSSNDGTEQSKSIGTGHRPSLISHWPSLAVFACFIGFATWFWTSSAPNADDSLAARADRLLEKFPLIDGHNDLPYLLRLEMRNQIYNTSTFTFATHLESHTDLKKMKDGLIGGQFWSVFVECPDIEHLDDPNHNVRDTLEQIDVAKRFIDEYEPLYYCETSSCAFQAFQKGKIPSMLGAEGMHQIGSAIAVIRQFWDLGVRYITLTHNCDNPFATAASTVTETGTDGGLTSFGAEAVHEMNRLGMMVDLSHVSHLTMRNVLDITKSPVMFSHSACYGLAANYRNAPDDVIARLKENGGVLMVMFVKRFLDAKDPESADLERAVDHIFHIVNLAGWSHVGIGADFDGTVTLANGINDVSDYPQLIEAVMRRGASDEDVKNLIGGNILRYVEGWNQERWLANDRQQGVERE